MHLRLIGNFKLSLGVSVCCLVLPRVTVPSHQDSWKESRNPQWPRVQDKHRQKGQGLPVSIIIIITMENMHNTLAEALAASHRMWISQKKATFYSHALNCCVLTSCCIWCGNASAGIWDKWSPCMCSRKWRRILWFTSCGFATVPLTARLIRISSKSLWSSMAATSQRYSAVSDRVVLKIRMLAGSLSWALFSKSPLQREKRRLHNRPFTHAARLHGPEKHNSGPSSRRYSLDWALSLEWFLQNLPPALRFTSL